MDKYKIDFSSYKKKFSYCKTNTKCSVDNCNNPIFCKGYCTKHYAQIQHYGKIINTIYDKNEIIKHDDYAEIIVRNKQGAIKGKALIDLDDVDKCKRFKWGMYSNSYFYGNINKILRIRLHRFVLGLDDWNINNEVDHINRNRADNRKSNLRIVNRSDNNKNRNKSCSKAVNMNNDNVYFDKKRNRYYGRYNYQKITYNTSYYKNRDDALNEMNIIKQILSKGDTITYSFS